MKRSSALDIVRLELACLVIFSHAFGLLSGIEPGAFGETAGGWALRGFFLLSGYLIASSWRSDPDLSRFAIRRFARIAPAYYVAFAIAVLIVGPIGGARSLPLSLLGDLATFSEPKMLAFAGSRGPFVDGPMYTIRWEIMCYLATPLLFPLLKRRVTMIFAVVGLACATFWRGDAFALPLCFLTGAWLSTASFRLPDLRIRFPDVSYGAYLYGWPIQKLLVFAGIGNPWLLFALALPSALAVGYLSARFVERPAQAWAKALAGRRLGAPDRRPSPAHI